MKITMSRYEASRIDSLCEIIIRKMPWVESFSAGQRMTGMFGSEPMWGWTATVRGEKHAGYFYVHDGGRKTSLDRMCAHAIGALGSLNDKNCKVCGFESGHSNRCLTINEELRSRFIDELEEVGVRRHGGECRTTERMEC